MSKLIKCVTENFSTEEELTEVTNVLRSFVSCPHPQTHLSTILSFELLPSQVSEFFGDHPEIGCERTIRQAKENISLNLYWKNRDLDSVARFLETQKD